MEICADSNVLGARTKGRTGVISANKMWWIGKRVSEWEWEREAKLNTHSAADRLSLCVVVCVFMDTLLRLFNDAVQCVFRMRTTNELQTPRLFLSLSRISSISPNFMKNVFRVLVVSAIIHRFNERMKERKIWIMSMHNLHRYSVCSLIPLTRSTAT